MFKTFFRKKLITGSVKGIDLQDIPNNGKYIENKVCYDTTKELYLFLLNSIKDYIDFLNINRKTENDIKLEKLGLTSSKAYVYGLTKIDEEYLYFVDLYKEKYPNNIYIPENSFQTLNLQKIYKKDFQYNIPDNVIDSLFKFMVDDNDFKITEYVNGYNGEIGQPSPFTFNEVKESLEKGWSIQKYIDEYVKKLERGEITYIGSSVYIAPEKVKTLGKDFIVRQHYKAERHFFFLASKPEERKKTFKEFMDDTKNEMEFLVLQPVKGGYLLIANW